MKKLLYYLWECLHGVLCQFMRKLRGQAFVGRRNAVLAQPVNDFSAWLINPALAIDDLSKKQYLIH
jgi:hypothetical protein